MTRVRRRWAILVLLLAGCGTDRTAAPRKRDGACVTGGRCRFPVHVDGRRWTGAPAAVPLRRHAQVVVQEPGPPVPVNTNYLFPPGR